MNLLSDALLPEFHAILSLLRSKALSLSQIAESTLPAISGLPHV